ncbi:MAG TPA: thioesterase family protein [Haliangium sp.]|nr:thioesterase family protein [Haliangium sp.]
MTQPQSFFVAGSEAGTWVSTELTRGPWSPEYQHGGPPAALLARALERDLADLEPSARIVRMTVEIVRPIPIAALAIEVERVRTGRQVQELRGRILVDGREVCRATALCIRTTALDLAAPAGARLTPPEQSAPFEFPFFTEPVGYHTGMEVRFARGTFGSGAVAAWMRMRAPLVPGEEPSPLQRVMIAADSGNGVSAALDTARFTFVNPDLTVYLHRPPVGEWVCLDATTTTQPSGIGLADSALHDALGPIGRSLQSLVVARR